MELKSVVTGLAVWCRDIVLWCQDRAGPAGRCLDRAQATKRAMPATEHTTPVTKRMACASCAHDRAVLSCGTLHWALQLIELQCSCTVHEHCS